MTRRYSAGFVDWRRVYGLTTPGSTNNDINPKYHGKESVDKNWACPYCRNLYTDNSTNCRSCGAPK